MKQLITLKANRIIMKKWLFILIVPVFFSTACSKKDKVTDCNVSAPVTIAPASETAYLQNYLTAKNITATQINGMFYTMSNPGSGTSPNLCSIIGVTYVGTYINGTADGAQFDAGTVSFTLSKVIEGWQIVFPLIKTGGSATLFIPPALAYGYAAFNGIPANSYLKFTVTLNSVN